MKPQIMLVGVAAISTIAAPPPVDPISSTNIAISDSTHGTATSLTVLQKRDECNTCRRTCKLKNAFWPWPFLPWRMKKCNKRCKPICDAYGQDKNSHHKYMQPKPTQTPKTTKKENDDDAKDDRSWIENLHTGTGDMAAIDAMMDVDMSEEDLDIEFEKAFAEYFGTEPSEEERSDMNMLD